MSARMDELSAQFGRFRARTRAAEARFADVGAVGVGAGRSLSGEGAEDISLGGDEPWFDKSEIDEDQSPEQTRRNLDT